MELERQMDGDDEFCDQLAECHERMMRGESTGSIVKLCEARGETLDEDLQSCLECLTLIDRVRRHQEIDSFLTTRLLSPTSVHSDSPKRIAHFVIERELGQGGAGTVHLATDTKLGRKVALKVPHPHILLSQDLQQRFLSEAEATARFDHPHIVRVYEVGQVGPICFLATEFCDGPTLHQWLSNHDGPVSPRVAATIVRDLAEAVQHAHSQAVIHRDIKPSNVLVVAINGESEEQIPFVKLCDFGLAKVIDAETGQTKTGDLLGTPAYMAPEQAEGKLREIDTRTDVYSLGAVLFELLVRRAVFEGGTRSAILLKVISEEPPNPRSLRKDIPLDLSVIVAKSLSKTKKDRYISAADMADDLNRFLSGCPIKARPVSWHERLLKWMKRRPATAAAAALGILFPVTVLVLSLWGNAVLFEKNREIMRRLYTADMRSAKQALDEYRMEDARSLLDKYQPSIGTPDVTTLPWHLLTAQVKPVAKVEWKCHEADIYSLDISPDGQNFATASRDGTACIWDLKSGTLIRRLIGHDREVNVVTFSPDGTVLATASDDGSVRVWQTTSGKCLYVIKAHIGQVGCLVFHPDGTQLTSASQDGSVRTWKIDRGEATGSEFHFDHGVSAVTYSPDGMSLVVATNEVALYRMSIASKAITWKLSANKGFSSRVRTLIVARGKDMLFVGSSDGVVREVELSTGDVVFKSDRRARAITSLRLRSDESGYVVSDLNGSISMLRLSANDGSVPIYSGHSRIWDCRVIGGDREVLTASADGCVRKHRMPTSDDREIRQIAMIRGGVRDLAISKNGQSLFAGGENELAIIDSNSGQILKQRSNFSSKVLSMDLSPDETLVATGELSGRVYIWDAKNLSLVAESPAINPPSESVEREVFAVRFIPNSTWLAFGCNEGLLVIWDYHSNTIIWKSQLQFPIIFDISLTPDGRIIVGCRGGIVGLERKNGGYIEYFSLETPDSIFRIGVNDNQTFVSSSNIGQLRLHRAHNGSVYHDRRLYRRSPIDALALSSSKKWLATGARACDLSLVQSEQISSLSTTVFSDGHVYSTAFSPDCSVIYAGLSDGRVIVRKSEFYANDLYIDPVGSLGALKMSPDDTLISVRNSDPWMKLLSTDPLRRVPSWLGRDFESASFSPDGKELLLSQANRLYRCKTTDLDHPSLAFREVEHRVKDVCCLTNNRLLVRDISDGLRIVHLSSETPDRILWEATDGIQIERLALSADYKRIAASTTDRQIRLWETEGGAGSSVPSPEEAGPICFFPLENKLAVGGSHGSIQILNLDTHEWEKPLHYSANTQARAIAFADNGETMLTAGSGGGIQLWNMTTKEQVYEMDHDYQFDDIVVRQSKGVVVASGGDPGGRGVVKIYRVPPYGSSHR